jgi:serine/threonine protein kinase
VHGDLKAANVLLATAGAEPDSAWGQALGRRLVAKVADFGLAVPLGPTQTHASLTARGTPSHMASLSGCDCFSLR